MKKEKNVKNVRLKFSLSSTYVPEHSLDVVKEKYVRI